MRKKMFNLLIIVEIFILMGCGTDKDKYDALKGIWKSSIENQNIYNIDDGEIVGGKEDYFLKCDGRGYYELTTESEDLANARYTVLDNIVTFYDEGREILGICKINDNELDCTMKSYYAFKYTKIE